MLAFREIDKRFGATHAVKGVTIEVQEGSVLGLVGENGAGKSTLIKIASGVLKADGGQIELDNAPVLMHHPHDALSHGIVSVFQELTLVGQLTVEQNLFLLDQPRTRWGTIDRRRLRQQCNEVLARYQLSIRPADRVSDLPLGQQQMLEIVRAAQREPRVLLLDEATSALGQREVEWLIALVRRMRDAGRIVLFISHRWDEVTEFSDRVAVMRNGGLVTVAATGDMTQDLAVKLMTGRSIEATFPSKPASRTGQRLRVENIGSAVLHEVSLTLAPGEIVGLGGLVGQGQDLLLESLFGVHPLKHGSVQLDHRPLRIRGPEDAIAAGIAYVPQERKSEGLFLHKSIAFNMTYSILRRLTGPLGLVSRERERSIVGESMETLKIRARSGSSVISELSGGNQQKVLLQKWLLTKPAVLLLNDVTRGVDIGTKIQIYNVINDIARHGVSILIYSTDTMELVELANRVLVMVEGRIARELSAGDLTAEAIVRAAIGQRGGDALVA